MSCRFPFNSVRDTLLVTCDTIVDELKGGNLTAEERELMTAIGGLLFAADIQIEKLEKLKTKQIAAMN